MKMLVLSLLLLLVAGCSKHFTANQLVGKYVLNVGDDRDVLQLNGDGTYIHSYRSTDGKTSTANGTWELKNFESEPSVVLDNYQPPPGEAAWVRGIYFLSIRSFFGHIRLNINTDLNEGYDKQP